MFLRRSSTSSVGVHKHLFQCDISLINIYSVIGNLKSFQTKLLLDQIHPVFVSFPTFNTASNITLTIASKKTSLKSSVCLVTSILVLLNFLMKSFLNRAI